MHQKNLSEVLLREADRCFNELHLPDVKPELSIEENLCDMNWKI